MALIKYVPVLFVFFVNIDAGGHGEEHHDHVKLHVPEFIHHDHHTKVITIHHHHHKPKKEHHHHHHHHHPKPHIPPLPHGYYHHHKKSSSHSVSKGHSNHHGHGNHGHHGHHGHHSSRGHHGHHGHHGHYGNKHKHNDPPAFNYDSDSLSHDPPSVSYEPPKINYNPGSTFTSDYGSFAPSVPNIPNSPHLHGVVHTVKQVKVFDSLPGALPGHPTAGQSNTGSHGYEVTEQGEEDEDDVFTAVNTLSQTYPGTYGFIRNAAPESDNNPFGIVSQQSTAQSPNHDPFATVAQPTSFANVAGTTGSSESFASSFPTNGIPLPSVQQSSQEFSENDITGGTGLDNSENIIVGDVSGPSYLSAAEGFNDDSPVTFSREAGIQQTVNTGAVETIAY